MAGDPDHLAFDLSFELVGIEIEAGLRAGPEQKSSECSVTLRDTGPVLV